MHYLYYVYVVSAVISLVGIASALIKRGKVRVNRRLARATFFIFLSHIFVLRYTGRVLSKLIPGDSYPLLTAGYLLRPLITAAVCLVIYRLLELYLPRLLGVLTGGRIR